MAEKTTDRRDADLRQRKTDTRGGRSGRRGVGNGSVLSADSIGSAGEAEPQPSVVQDGVRGNDAREADLGRSVFLRKSRGGGMEDQYTMRPDMQPLEDDGLEPGGVAGGQIEEDARTDYQPDAASEIKDIPLPAFAAGSAGVKFRVRNGAYLRLVLGNVYERTFEAGAVFVEARNEFERYLRPTGFFEEVE